MYLNLRSLVWKQTGLQVEVDNDQSPKVLEQFFVPMIPYCFVAFQLLCMVMDYFMLDSIIVIIVILFKKIVWKNYFMVIKPECHFNHFWPNNFLFNFAKIPQNCPDRSRVALPDYSLTDNELKTVLCISPEIIEWMIAFLSFLVLFLRAYSWLYTQGEVLAVPRGFYRMLGIKSRCPECKANVLNIVLPILPLIAFSYVLFAVTVNS